jgi:hypothetical protein
MVYIKAIMIRTQIYLTEEERKFFKKEAYEREIAMSEVIREILDKYIEEKSKNV